MKKWLWGGNDSNVLPKKVGRRGKSKKTKGNNAHTLSYTQTWARQMRAATRGLQLFIMKGIHRSVLALPLSTQFFHTGPPFLPLVPSLLSVSLFSLFNISFSIHFGAKEDWVCDERERKSELREEESCGGSRSAGQLGGQRGAVLVTSPSTRPIYWQGLCAQERLLYLGICGALLGGWRKGGGAP